MSKYIYIYIYIYICIIYIKGIWYLITYNAGYAIKPKQTESYIFNIYICI